MTRTYKGREITKTNTTTDSVRYCYGKQYSCIKNVFEIEGIHGFATSWTEAKKMINEQIEYRNFLNNEI